MKSFETVSIAPEPNLFHGGPGPGSGNPERKRQAGRPGRTRSSSFAAPGQAASGSVRDRFLPIRSKAAPRNSRNCFGRSARKRFNIPPARTQQNRLRETLSGFTRRPGLWLTAICRFFYNGGQYPPGASLPAYMSAICGPDSFIYMNDGLRDLVGPRSDPS